MDALRIEVHEDIRKAETLPKRFYTEAGLFERAKERVFARSWQLVGSVEQLEHSESIAPLTLLEGCLDEPLVLTHDAQGVKHCLSNVCTHRANLIATAAGREKQLTCAYHGRRFDLAGRMRAAPEFEAAEHFPSSADDLAPLPLESLGPLFFTRLAPRHSFDEHVGDLRERLGTLLERPYRFDAASTRDYIVEAHWALYCDNYLEGLHIPFVHAKLNAAVDYGTYTTELLRHSSVQVARGRGARACFDTPALASDGAEVAAYYAWVFPNLMLNFYPWGLSLNLVEPIGLQRTRVRFFAYVSDASRRERGAGSGLHEVELEDEAVVQGVQQGMRSSLYQRGRYSPTREQGVHHFHRLLVAALRD